MNLFLISKLNYKNSKKIHLKFDRRMNVSDIILYKIHFEKLPIIRILVTSAFNNLTEIIIDEKTLTVGFMTLRLCVLNVIRRLILILVSG